MPNLSTGFAPSLSQLAAQHQPAAEPRADENAHHLLRAHARALGVAVAPTLLPRVLARHDPKALSEDAARHRAEKDIDTKCSRYLWFESREACRAVMVGEAGAS